MDDPQDIALRRAQGTIAAFPTIILGCGASAQYGLPGMSELGRHLVKSIEPVGDEEHRGWKQFKALLSECNDLEKAMQGAELASSMVEKIVRQTWSLISSSDFSAFKRSLCDVDYFSLSRLFRCLLDSSSSRLYVVTTNYDCLAEYAANAAELFTFCGFRYGYTGKLSGEVLIHAPDRRPVQIVDISKVHGSLDWFVTANGDVVCVPGARELLDGWMPLIVTPGVSKYEKTHLEPFRTVLARADRALVQAKAYITIGYGFNDIHIQPKLITGIEQNRKKILILARSLSGAVRVILGSGRVKDYLAIEQDGKSSRLYCPEFPAGESIGLANLWNLADFMNWATIH